MLLWQKTEKRNIESLGGRHHSSSGKAFYQKGDGHNDLFVIEHKFSKKQVNVTSKMLSKVEQDALCKGKSWLLIVEIEGAATPLVIFPRNYAPDFLANYSFETKVQLKGLPFTVRISTCSYFTPFMLGFAEYVAIDLKTVQREYNDLFY